MLDKMFRLASKKINLMSRLSKWIGIIGFDRNIASLVAIRADNLPRISIDESFVFPVTLSINFQDECLRTNAKCEAIYKIQITKVIHKQKIVTIQSKRNKAVARTAQTKTKQKKNDFIALHWVLDVAMRSASKS